MKKQGILVVISILCLAVFTSCASNADTMPTPMVTAAPTTQAPTATVGPTVSIAPTQTADMNGMNGMGMEGGVNTIEDSLRVSEQAGEEVEKLSELDSAEVVIAGNIALVGISYDTQYQGGLTERLQQMITERVEMVDKAVTTVHVTDEEDAVVKISQLREKLKAADLTFEELQTQLLEIGSAITGAGQPEVSAPQSSTGT